MSYKIAIRNNETNEIQIASYEFEWYKSEEHNDFFWWKDGNMGCDCNRELEWIRAAGPGPADDPFNNGIETECGDSRFSVLYADLPDGTRIIIDEILMHNSIMDQE